MVRQYERNAVSTWIQTLSELCGLPGHPKPPECIDEKAISEMDKIDESELTEAEDKLFLETQLRINNKLAEAAINY